MSNRTPPEICALSDDPIHALGAFIGQELEHWGFRVNISIEDIKKIHSLTIDLDNVDNVEGQTVRYLIDLSEVEVLGYRTKSGKYLTDEDLEKLADEAEKGYDISPDKYKILFGRLPKDNEG